MNITQIKSDTDLLITNKTEPQSIPATVVGNQIKAVADLTSGSGASRWQFVKNAQNFNIDVVESTVSTEGYIRTNAQILVFNKYGGFYRLNAFNIDFASGKDVFFLSASSSEYVALNDLEGGDFGICYVMSASMASFTCDEKIVIGTAWGSGFGWSSIYNIFQPKDRMIDFFISPPTKTDLVVTSNPDKSITVVVNNRVPVFNKRSNSFYWLKVGTYTIPNSTRAIFGYDDADGGVCFYVNSKTPDQTYLSIYTLPVFEYDFNNMNAVLGVNWNGIFTSEHPYLMPKSVVTNANVLKYSDYVPSLAIKNSLRPFFDKLNALTDNDPPLEVMAVGDSISNFQHSGVVKLDRTVEPQGLYGNTFLRWIWRRLNFTYTFPDDQDQVANPFANSEPEEWGKLRFLRADNVGVTKSSEFVPSGTRESDGNKIYWSQRQNINGLTTSLNGYRTPVGDNGIINSSAVGNVTLHNQVYFFNNIDNSYIEFTVPAAAKGFSIVYWGDDYQAAFPRLEGGTWEYLTFDAEVKVNGVVVGNIDQTVKRGQSRENFILPASGPDRLVRVTNKSAGRTMNVWGLEYWTGKCVRLTNFAAAGNQASAFYNNPDYMLNKAADLIVWQTTTLNNVWRDSDPTPEHKALGALLKAKNVPMLVTTCHPVCEAATLTNYPEVAVANPAKDFQHKDAYAAQKALYELELPFVDAFGCFRDIAIPYEYTGDYNQYFIDGGHLSDVGEKVYSDLFNHILSWKNTIK